MTYCPIENLDLESDLWNPSVYIQVVSPYVKRWNVGVRIREKVIVNSFVVLAEPPERHAQRLPKETAIKVRIAEFFVHHESSDLRVKRAVNLLIC